MECEIVMITEKEGADYCSCDVFNQESFLGLSGLRDEYSEVDYNASI